uniref:Inka box actin regulator 2 n=1 Tax=Seriola dumerili TaxID=41447 RepID=A0A3B4VBP7_SERDU
MNQSLPLPMCLSMKEAGDGLHAQMNSMMGALQELKLLQVQTALENLDISGRPINRGIPHPATRDDNSPSRNRSSLRTSSSSASSLESESEGTSRTARSENDLESIPRRWSGYTAPQVDFYGPMVGNPPPDDWTSSLMSRSRNRQPLVLGDNVFADLVGNWLDLPERREERMEICRKFSLTTNIFKKFLRSVRPDRDKLLKERPGWMAPELPEGDLFKRPKKLVPKSSKGSFYLPFWANGQQGKGRPSSFCPGALCPSKASNTFSRGPSLL